MKQFLKATASAIVLAGMQIASLTAIAQSTSQRTTIDHSGGGSASAGSRQLSLLCHAHRQRLGDWERGGRPGRIFSPTSALAVFSDDSPARYAAEIEQLCAGVTEPDANMLAQLQADREAVRTPLDNVQSQPPSQPSTQGWNNLPRRQAQGGADVFDDAVNRQSDGQEAKQQLAQRIPELSEQAIAEQSVDLTSVLLGNLANALVIQEAVTRQLSIRQTPIRQAPQISNSAGGSLPAAIAPPVRTSSTNPYANNTPLPDPTPVAGQQSQTKARPYRPNANTCISMSGNQLANNCSYAVWIAFCVQNPRQTKNFFDSSDAFKCPSSGLERISANGRNGLIWHGSVVFFACDERYIGSMKTTLSSDAYGSNFYGLCGGGDAPAPGSERYDRGWSFQAN